MDIEARDDKHAFSKANMIADNQNLKWPAQDWIISGLMQRPFASLITTEIDIEKLKLEKIVKDEKKDLPF